MSINQRVFELLVDGKTQQKMADFVGIKSQTITTWKSRGSDPPAKLIHSIAKYLGVTDVYLLTGEDCKTSNAINGTVNGSAFVQGTNRGSVTVHNGHEHTLSEEASELLRLYEDLNFKKRVKLLQTAIDLSESENEPNQL